MGIQVGTSVTRTAIVIGLLALLANVVGPQAVGASPGPTETDASPPGRRACGTWVETPVPGDSQYPGGFGHVTDVEVVSSSEVWAVSDHGYESFNEAHIYRWNGAVWRRIPFPRPDTGSVETWSLEALAVVSPSELWAVGYKVMNQRISRPLAARWNGQRWQLVPIGLWKVRGALDGIAVVPGTRRLVAVGWRHPAGERRGSETLALRWNGDEWRRMSTPTPGRSSWYTDVVAARNQLWAVGGTKRPGDPVKMLASRRTAAGWTSHVGPAGWIEAVDGVRSDSLFAVGGRARDDGDGIIVRWDGDRWRLVKRFDRVNSGFDDVVATGPNRAWAVGSAFVKDWNAPRPYVVTRGSGGWRIDWHPKVVGYLSAIGGRTHDLWTFRTSPPVENAELWRFTSFRRC